MLLMLAVIEVRPFHILLVLVIGIVFFGKRLPEVGRFLGKRIVEFKEGQDRRPPPGIL